MSAETASNLKFEIGHVLFIDIVGYSKLSVSDQLAPIEELTPIVSMSSPVAWRLKRSHV
jgi:hypothetical protein